jgi:2-methylcitrate dehydratase PrpD
VITTASTATASLAAFASGLTYEQLSEAVRREARRCLLDFLGTALGGSPHPIVDVMLRAAASWQTAPQASVLGRGNRVDLLTAALVNGAMAHVHDFDDTHLASIVHPTSPLWPSILALAEVRGSSAGEKALAEVRGSLTGKQWLAAFVAGFEVECRVGAAAFPSHDAGAYHSTGIFGPLGAAAACSNLLGFSPERTAMAISAAASQAAGLRVQFGTMTKSLHVGNAARSGLIAALLVEQGLDAALTPIEAERGLLTTFAPVERRLEALTEGLGHDFQILHNSVKPYSCGVVTHPLIDCVITLRREHKLTPEQVVSIEAEVHPLVINLTGKPEPRVGLEGKFSAYHCAAVSLIDGVCGPDQFTDARVNDPSVVELRRKVRLNANPEIAEHEAEVCLTLADGRCLTIHIPFHQGTPENPVTDQALQAKFRGLLGMSLPPERADQIIATVDRVAELTSPEPLLALCRP